MIGIWMVPRSNWALRVTKLACSRGHQQLPIGSIFGHHHLKTARQQQKLKPPPFCISAAKDAIRELESGLAVGAKEATTSSTVIQVTPAWTERLQKMSHPHVV